MAEYIERAEIMRRFTYEQGDKIREMDEKGFPTTITFRDAKRLILEIPSVDVAPIVHAKWENNKNEYPECTNCGYMPAYDPAIDDINYSPYCPNCGAKMDGKEIEKQREELKKKEQIMRDAQLIARDLGFVIRAGDYRTALRVVESFGRDENT